ncbi:hypothetical protein [uncultured Paludibaculum sp.]|uniref:hypothetical protein n=1 Tax=uncultured Paludibaculum sp. TaxID=1765020 RepID=UPI002AAC02A2|nr:hypothetical protein [uncultured Paludibaculum sp.]
MNKLYLVLIATSVLAIPAGAQQVTRRANITGHEVNGKCTIEVNVDGAAEVEVQGSQGRMRNLSGQPAVWRRFVCDGQMPANPHDFRFRGIDGRGSVQLVQDPRQNGGRIVFRIDDPDGGREGYTVDLEWRGSSEGQWSNQDTRGWMGPNARGGNAARDERRRDDRRDPGVSVQIGGDGVNRDGRYYNENGRWNESGTAEAIRMCQAEVAERIARDGFRNIAFRNVAPDNNPGRNDFVNGRATAQQGRRGNANFQFSCSVNLANGQVRSAEVRRRR